MANSGSLQQECRGHAATLHKTRDLIFCVSVASLAIHLVPPETDPLEPTVLVLIPKLK